MALFGLIKKMYGLAETVVWSTSSEFPDESNFIRWLQPVCLLLSM